MKKYIAFMLTIVLLLCSTGCSSIALQNNNHEFIITPKRCNSLFSCNPNEVRDAFEHSPWIEGHFVSATENEDGNLLLVLSDSDIRFWKAYIEKKIEKYHELSKVDGLRFELNESYTSLTYYSTKELMLAVGWTMTEIALYCGLMQMLNGDDPNTWYVDVAMADVETGKIVGQGRIPDEEFNVSSEDWDRVLGEAVE